MSGTGQCNGAKKSIFMNFTLQLSCHGGSQSFPAGQLVESGHSDLPSLIEAKVMPGIPLEAQEQRVSNGIQSLLVAACLGESRLLSIAR